MPRTRDERHDTDMILKKLCLWVGNQTELMLPHALIVGQVLGVEAQIIWGSKYSPFLLYIYNSNSRKHQPLNDCSLVFCVHVITLLKRVKSLSFKKLLSILYYLGISACCTGLASKKV